MLFRSTLYKIPGSKNDQIRGGITRTYKAPNVAQLVPRRGIASNNSPTTPDTMGNPQLKPELAWGLDLAYEHYLSDLRSGSPEAAKSYGTYDKLVKTLVTLEKELHARQIASKEFIRTQTAIERFGKILNEIRSELTQFATKVAARANPDNPGKALKAIDDEVNGILSRVSQAVGDAESTVKSSDGQPDEPVVVEQEDTSEEDEVEDAE